MPRAPLRICIVAPPSLRVPPSGYGGTQRGIRDLVVGLRQRGHHVTLCAPGDSTVEVDELISPLAAALWEADSPVPVAERAHAAADYAAQVGSAIVDPARLTTSAAWDVINVRFDNAQLLRRLIVSGVAPVLYSLHNFNGPFFGGFFAGLSTLPGFFVNGHSEAHRAQFPDLPTMRVVPYGMDVASTPWSAAPLATATWKPSVPLLERLRHEGRNYVLSIGRISPQKAQAEAIAAAKLAGRPLVLVGAPEAREAGGAEYYDREVRPAVDGVSVIEFGRANEVERQELMRGALAVILTTGMAQVGYAQAMDRPLMEAPAAGTPLVGFADGSTGELVTPETGRLGRTVSELAAGLVEAKDIDRTRCRQAAEARFGQGRYAADYEREFHRVIDAVGAGAAGPARGQ